MASLIRRLVRLVRVLDDVRSVVRALKLLRKLVRGLKGARPTA
ncbi:hypothetical protein [Halegenticoccus tardaugens]|nr:hypothetical protein [Halegenticoccus tardaugens]